MLTPGELLSVFGFARIASLHRSFVNLWHLNGLEASEKGRAPFFDALVPAEELAGKPVHQAAVCLALEPLHGLTHNGAKLLGASCPQFSNNLP